MTGTSMISALFTHKNVEIENNIISQYILAYFTGNKRLEQTVNRTSS